MEERGEYSHAIACNRRLGRSKACIVIPASLSVYVEGPLADPVARWVVVADDDDPGASVALHPGAAHAGGTVPHDLGEVAAHLLRRARVVGGVIVVALRRPALDGVRRLPVLPRPPEQVLPVRALRVLHGAVAPPEVRPAARVIGQRLVPHEGRLADGGAHLVVRGQELIGRVGVLSLAAGCCGCGGRRQRANGGVRRQPVYGVVRHQPVYGVVVVETVLLRGARNGE